MDGQERDRQYRCGREVGGGRVNNFRLALNGRRGVERANVLGR